VKDLSVTIKGTLPFLGSKKKVLSGVCGVFPRGKLVAVMGPSGSGKTTLLNSIFGGVSGGSGSLYLDGIKSKHFLRDFRESVGFVPQDDDTIDPLLTVEEVLLHSARLRLPRTMSQFEIRTVVDETISALSLDHIRNQIIGTGIEGEGDTRGISGGQRKRVNIGVELVARPLILLLDEPTSGLDSTTATSIIKMLQQIAYNQRINVIATIHQPSQVTQTGIFAHRFSSESLSNVP
jgi:ABC-type multidrug transport system ATPase subunit